MQSLAEYLRSSAAVVQTVAQPVSVLHEMTALQHALDRRREYPILLFQRPVLRCGTDSALPVVNNLTASRELVAAALGIDDHRDSAAWFANRTAAGIDPLIVGAADAPVQQRIFSGEEVDLGLLPALVQHELEPGPYLTAAHATTFDPDSGIDNTAIQRCWICGPRKMTWLPYPSSHNARNLQKFWSRGEPCPVAFWIGHHPAVLMGTQAKLAYPQSHWRAAGGVLGEPLRLVPSVTHGERVMVPADAEIVIEGLAHPGQLSADGPFGEYTGYLGPQVPAPIVEVTHLTRRDQAIYHDYGSGLTDMLVPDNMAMEGKLYGMIRAVAPALRNVHVPASGRRFHAWIQLQDPAPGEARDALAAALAYRRVKTAIVVDEDIDLFDAEEVMWALATRVQWDRDLIQLQGLTTSTLDPSLDAGAQTGAKLGVDATLPGRPGPGKPRPVAPRATVPASAQERASRLLAAMDPAGWPGA